MPIHLTTNAADFESSFAAFLAAKREVSDDVDAAVRAIIDDVRSRGDDAVIELTRRFDRLDLAFHAPRLFAASLLVFECGDWAQQRARLDAGGIALSGELPRGQDQRRGGLIEAPEGTALWMIGAA